MQIKFFVVIFVAMIVLFSIISKPVTAVTLDRFEVDAISESEREQIILNMELAFINSEVGNASIKCFSVSSNNLIAVGLDTSPRKTINIYNSNGLFQYGYTFKTYGDYFIGWENENLLIYLVRDGSILAIDNHGEYVNIFTVKETTNNNKACAKLYTIKEQEMNGKQYYLEDNDSLLAKSSQLIALDLSGAKCIIYNAKTEVLATNCLVLLFVALVSMAVIHNIFVIISKRNLQK